MKTGRSYRAIMSGGKEYRYYDDEPAYPGDVWDDISHLQQKDPQRTGYETQKPLKLLERIVSCSSQEGDLICDLFAGSGTSAVAAAGLNRRFCASIKARWRLRRRATAGAEHGGQAAGFHLRRGSAVRRGRLRGGSGGLSGDQLVHSAAHQL